MGISFVIHWEIGKEKKKKKPLSCKGPSSSLQDASFHPTLQVVAVSVSLGTASKIPTKGLCRCTNSQEICNSLSELVFQEGTIHLT